MCVEVEMLFVAYSSTEIETNFVHKLKFSLHFA